MWESNNVLVTEKVIINFLEETITWKPSMYNPKDAIKFRKLIELSNSGKAITADDFK